ncbi:SIMPL domain-containing protein [Methylobacterium radiotolerans]|uniref:SIMPL domain-containing protein n=1 Tax=Methylobacterium radiotolerans TaxID=31998 RepID=UPI0038D0F653
MKQRRVASLLVGVAMLPLLGLICSHASGLPTEDEGYPAYGTSTPSVATVDGKARPIAPAALRVADDEGNDPTAEEGSGPPPESDEDRRLAGSGMDHLEEIRRAVSAAAHPVAPARITMAGEGVFRAKPDAAVFRLGVRSYSEKAATAMEANAKVARRLQEALSSAGVKPDEIATEQISLETEPGQDPGSDRKARYVAQNSISVDIRDLPSRAPTFLGGIVVAARDAGVTDVSGPEFRLIDDAKAQAAARRDAVDDAMVKAATYVHALGAKVGRIVEVRDSGVGSDPVVAQAMRMGTAPPVSNGAREVTARVTVVWEIDQ